MISSAVATPRWVNVEQLAGILSITPGQVYDLKRRGLLASKIGKSLIFDMSDVVAFMEKAKKEETARSEARRAARRLPKQPPATVARRGRPRGTGRSAR